LTEASAPVCLICTVGGSPQPIATAIELIRPAAVWFLVSDPKTGESSRGQVEEREIVYDQRTGAVGRGLGFVDGCPPAVTIRELPADDPDRGYALCRSWLAEARMRYPDHRFIADYTGGTKSMTGALLMAAFAERDVEVQFMAGARPDLAQVRSGSERPKRMAADFILAERDFASAQDAVGGYDYAAATQILDNLDRRISRLSAKPPQQWRKKLSQSRRWAGVMARWDAFEHGKAADTACNSGDALSRALEESGHLTPLVQLGHREKGKPGWDVCADLWLNALRRGGRGRYDDAVARLYRLTEAAVQARLWTCYRLESERIPSEAVPEGLIRDARWKTDWKTGARYVELGLFQTVEFLRAKDPRDPFVLAFAGESASGEPIKGPKWLAKRNRSILAHGFTCVGEQDWCEARRWCEEAIVPFFPKEARFEQLPRELPDF